MSDFDDLQPQSATTNLSGHRIFPSEDSVKVIGEMLVHHSLAKSVSGDERVTIT